MAPRDQEKAIPLCPLMSVGSPGRNCLYARKLRMVSEKL